MNQQILEQDLESYKKEQKEQLIECAKQNAHNNYQIQIIEQIIDRCFSKKEVQQIMSLLTSRIKLGLVFDESPIIKSKNIITILEKDDVLSFSPRERERERELLPQHKLIIGDNYDALSNLLVTHKNRIDIIYIDPPYNTGGSNLGYFDKFSKTAWLNFMKERMLLAKQLLADDGVIFVSLDDNMQAYFKVMMDEIFGEENFVSQLIWDKRNAQNDAKQIESNHEYIIIYSKNKNLLSINKRTIPNTNKNSNFSLLLGNVSSGWLNNRPKMGQTIYWNEESNDLKIIIDYDIELAKTSNDYTKIYKNNTKLIEEGYIPIRPKIYGDKLGCWKWSPEKMEEEKNRLIVKKTNDGNYTLHYLDNRKDIKIGYKSIINNFSSSLGSKTLNEIQISFNNSKSVELISYLINIYHKKSAVVLDFFAGSGTTGHAVLDLNRNDNGTREFILCTKEFDDGNNIAIDVCYERLYRINNGQSKDGLKDFEWIKKHDSYNNSLNVYRLKDLDISIAKENFDLTLNKINLSIYNELNPNLNLNQENIFIKLYQLFNHLGNRNHD